MNSLWKWMGLAACGVGLACVADRMHAVTAAEDAPAYERPGESPDRLDRIAEKLDRLLERMEGRMGPGGPHPHMRRDIPPEMHEMLERRMREGRERMEKTREEIKERMEKARARFEQLEERVKALEAEVERLKATK